MPIDIRLPNITADTEAGRIAQMQSYMYQLVEQLNWAFATVTDAAGGKSDIVQYGEEGTAGMVITQQDAMAIFDSIKSLIIKSADIVEAYEEAMSITFDGKYVAESAYGTFAEQTKNQITLNSTDIEQNITDIEVITGEIESIRSTTGYIRSGKLEDGKIGIEIGQDNDDGFNRWARFTADGIYFYLPSSTEPIARMTTNKLVITNAAIATLTLGGYRLDTSNGLAFKWVGR